MKSIHKKIRHHFHTKKHHYTAGVSVFLIVLFFGFLGSIFFITRGSTPHTSELSFKENSVFGRGSVIPASCDAFPHVAGECVVPGPPAPTGLRYSCNADGTQVTLSWNASAGAISYNPRVWNYGSGQCPAGWTVYAVNGSLCYQEGNFTSTSYGTTPGLFTWQVGAGVPFDNYTPSQFSCLGKPEVSMPLDTNVSYGGSIWLWYSSTNATQCTFYVRNGPWINAWDASYDLGISYNWGSYGPYTGPATYATQCKNGQGGIDTKWMTVTPCPVATPIWNGTSCQTPSVNTEFIDQPYYNPDSGSGSGSGGG